MLFVSRIEYIMLPVHILLSSCLGWISSSSWSMLRGSWSLVDRRFFIFWSRRLLTVASTFERCLEIKLFVSPGHEVKWLRLIARRRVLGTEFKHAPLKYWANYVLGFFTLIIPFVEGEVLVLVEVEASFLGVWWRLDCLIGFFRGILHKPWLFLGPLIITLLLLIILRLYLVNNTMQLSSHNLPMETKEPVLRMTKMKACWGLGEVRS